MPEYNDTCTYKYSMKEWETHYSFGIEVGGEWITKEHTYHPWCPVDHDSWTYCTSQLYMLLLMNAITNKYYLLIKKNHSTNIDYEWSYRVDRNFLGSNEKNYTFKDIGRRSYREARKLCQDEGHGWDLASFQTMFSSSLWNFHQNENYSKSFEPPRFFFFCKFSKKQSKAIRVITVKL